MGFPPQPRDPQPAAADGRGRVGQVKASLHKGFGRRADLARVGRCVDKLTAPAQPGEDGIGLMGVIPRGEQIVIQPRRSHRRGGHCCRCRTCGTRLHRGGLWSEPAPEKRRARPSLDALGSTVPVPLLGPPRSCRLASPLSCRPFPMKGARVARVLSRLRLNSRNLSRRGQGAGTHNRLSTID